MTNLTIEIETAVYGYIDGSVSRSITRISRILPSFIKDLVRMCFHVRVQASHYHKGRPKKGK
jgi:hypothetical protein